MKIRHHPHSACRLGGLILAATIGGLATFSVPDLRAQATSSSCDCVWDRTTLDVDSLAARLPSKGDLYAKTRDEALSVYAKDNPVGHPFDADARKTIKLMCYLWVWGDPYSEGLWPMANHLAHDARDAGGTDPILDLLPDLYAQAHLDNPQLTKASNRAQAFLKTGYPTIFKTWYIEIAVRKLAQATRGEMDGVQDPVRDKIADLIKIWGQQYETLIREPLANIVLFNAGSAMQESVENDEPVLKEVHNELDRGYAEAAPASPVALALDGEYLTEEAWNARSSDWATHVTATQFQNFADYLAQADSVLEAAYARYPHEGEISRLMLKVELGQGQGRNRMEEWFQRAIAADPNDSAAYSAKFWYLQPRWYGSEEDLISFGQQCLDTQNWAAGIPTTFTRAIALQSDLDANIYQHPQTWALVEKVYRQSLEHYPKSSFYRTQFAHHAIQGEHWAVAKEEYDLLGDDWDKSVLTTAQHAHDIELAQGNGPIPSSAPQQQSDGGSAGGWFITILTWVWRWVM